MQSWVDYETTPPTWSNTSRRVFIVLFDHFVSLCGDFASLMLSSPTILSQYGLYFCAYCLFFHTSTIISTAPLKGEGRSPVVSSPLP